MSKVRVLLTTKRTWSIKGGNLRSTRTLPPDNPSHLAVVLLIWWSLTKPWSRTVLLQAFCTQCSDIAVQSDYEIVTSDERYRLHDWLMADDWLECCIVARPRRRYWSIQKCSLKVGAIKSAWTITFLQYQCLQPDIVLCLSLALCQVPGTLVKNTALMLMAVSLYQNKRKLSSKMTSSSAYLPKWWQWYRHISYIQKKVTANTQSISPHWEAKICQLVNTSTYTCRQWWLLVWSMNNGAYSSSLT